jgi:hypothetical protein
MKRGKITGLVGLLFALGVLIDVHDAGAGEEERLNARLKGEYAFTQIHICVVTNVPGEEFGPGFEVPPGGATSRTLSNEGRLTFNGDGTGSFDGRAFAINHSAIRPGAVAATAGPFTCPLTYTVNDDSSFTTELTCVSPDGAPIVSGLALRGQLQRGGRMLIASDTERNVETVHTAGGLLQRICGRSQTAIRVR